MNRPLDKKRNTKKVAVVVTTIYEPAFLSGYMENVANHGHTGEVEFLVIPDRQTPRSVYERCAFYRTQGYAVLSPTIEEQEEFLKKFAGLARRIPYNSDNRRHIGFLMALDRGTEVLISVDDDNFCSQAADFVGE